MSIRRLWTLGITLLIVVGATLQTVANYHIDLYGARRAAYEWLRGARRNGPQAYDAELLARLSHDAKALAADPDVASAIRRRAWDEVDGAARGAASGERSSQWIAVTDGVAHSSIPACRGAQLATRLRERSRGVAMCADLPVLLATSERAVLDGVRIYGVRPVDDDYATALRQVSGAEIAVVGPRAEVATSLRDLDGAPLHLGLDEAAWERVFAPGEYFGPETLSVPSYRGYTNGSTPYHVGASSFDAYILAAPLAGDDPASDAKIVFIAPRAILDLGALYSTLMLAACAAVIAALLAVSTGILVGRVTRPLARLGEVAARIGRGDTEARVGAVGGGRETELLAVTFDAMADSLAELRRTQAAAVAAAQARAEETSFALDRLRIAHDELHVSHAELREMQRKLVDASRLAGMAEVASNVLHNVGNLLNTVNVATEVAQRSLRGTKLPTLERAVDLVPEEPERLAEFLAGDPRAPQVLRLCRAVTTTLRAEQGSVQRELDVLARSIEHIKNVVRAQQKMASHQGTSEIVAPSEVLDLAIALHGAGHPGEAIPIVREYAPVEPRLLDRHRVMQVLMNLLSNARHAVQVAGRRAPRIVVRLDADDHGVRIEVADDGAGFPPELRDRLFEHGFTTKADGHGFGLHASANAAAEMGGTLTASSAGPGRGATFVLRLPAAAAARAA